MNQTDPDKLRYLSWWRAIGWLLVVYVSYASLAPGPVYEHPPRWDKVGHFLAYFTLMWWFAQVWPWSRHRRIAAAFAAMGIGMEFLQEMTGYRTLELGDMVADVCGVVIGWWLYQGPLGRVVMALDTLLRRGGRPGWEGEG